MKMIVTTMIFHPSPTFPSDDDVDNDNDGIDDDDYDVDDDYDDVASLFLPVFQWCPRWKLRLLRCQPGPKPLRQPGEEIVGGDLVEGGCYCVVAILLLAEQGGHALVVLLKPDDQGEQTKTIRINN